MVVKGMKKNVSSLLMKSPYPFWKSRTCNVSNFKLCGFGIFIPDHGSEFFASRIPYAGASKKFNILT
jgi:hypothetical protein